MSETPISNLTMPNFTVTKGSSVEVSSDEPGFYGAWYVATVVEEVDASPTKKRASSNKKSKNRNLKQTGFKVKYDTLVQEDNIHEPLTEVVPSSLVRPLPPRNVRRNNDSNAKEAEFVSDEEGAGGGDFELYDVVDAYHRDGWWVAVVKNVKFEGETKKYVVLFENPPEEFEFEKSNLRFHVDWVDSCWLAPSKKIPDEQLGFTTPAKQTVITDVTVDPPVSAKKNSSRKRSVTNSAVVTYSRNKRNVNSVENSSCKKRFKSSTGCKGNTNAIVSVLEISGCDNVNEVSLTQTREKRKRGRPSKLAVNTSVCLLQGTEENNDVNETPLAVWFKGMHPLSVLKRSSCFSPPDNSPNQAIVVTNGGGSETRSRTTTTNSDYQQDWPFIKRSPIWGTIESLELYQTPSQKPHFTPLKEKKEDFREGLAIAHMVTFGNIVQRLSDLQFNDSVDVINSSLETLCELESHGFDVGSIRARLNELLLLKAKVGPYEDKRKEVENEIEKSNVEKCRIEKELDRLKVKMKVLQEKTEQAVAMQKAKEEEIVRLKSNLDLVSNQINDVEIAFGEVCKKSLV